MAPRSKMPAWVRRRISDRPAARWITWAAARPPEAQPAPRAPQPAERHDYADNVVCFMSMRRTA